jgi:hypothetical protein
VKPGPRDQRELATARAAGDHRGMYTFFAGRRTGPVLLAIAAGLVLLSAAPHGPHAAAPLPAGHYGGPAAATWSVTSSPRWLGAAALKAVALREGLESIPASGSCTGIVGLDVPGGGGTITGVARCEFPGELARYNNRLAKLTAVESGDGLTGTATCCGAGEQITWTAQRGNKDILRGTASGSTTVTAVSVETRLGDIDVSLRIDWTVAFVVSRAGD